MGLFWGIFLNLALVLFVLNGLIWLRAKRGPQQPSDARPMFGAVTASFAGADFWSAALVVLINVAGGQVANMVAGPATELGNSEPPSGVNVGLVWVTQATILVATWVVIAWRNAQFLDWKWSGAAALLIFLASLVVVLGVAIITSI